MKSHESHVLLVACRDVQGFYRFPLQTTTPFPGINLEIIAGYSEIMQIEQTVQQHLGEDALRSSIQLRIKFEGSLKHPPEEPRSLFLAELIPSPDFEVPAKWLTLPEILRQMPKDKNRLPYMKVLQVLAGDLDQKVSAIELDDQLKEEIRRRLISNLGPQGE